MRIAPIETERLLLRGFTPQDAQFAVGIWNDPDMGEYLADEAMTEVDPEYLKSIELLGDDPDCCYLIAELRDSGERVGTCSFMPMENGSVYDIAYCVHKRFWRKGFATEMARGMADHARRSGASKVTIKIAKDNPGSNGVARKLGCRVAQTATFRKRGSDKIFEDYLYELDLK